MSKPTDEATKDEAFTEVLGGIFEDLDDDALDDAALDGLMLQGLRRRMGLTEREPRVGRFVLERPLGEGGMGVVYAARDPRVDRRVALKVLRRPPAGVEPGLREARALARLSHPNVVAVYEAGVYEGRVFMAMELVEGPTLRDWLATPRSWRTVCRTMGMAGRGLAAAHAVGIVHRDFKPDNVLLGSRVAVADFGLAIGEGTRSLIDGRSGDAGEGGAEGAWTPPEPGRRPGTFAYMAPEQLRGEAVDARADQFSFCVVLYEALAAERPFRADDPRRRLAAIEAGPDPGPLARVPRWLRALVLRGLHPRPEQRYPDLTTLLDAMERRRRPWGVGAVAMAVVGGSLWLLLPAAPPPCPDARAQLDGVWDEEQRRSLHSAFEATGRFYAADVSERVQRTLDGYAQAWVDAHAASCRATRVQGTHSAEVMDLQMRCLRQRRDELAQVVEVLVRADGARVSRAAELVAELPSLTRCEDVEALRATLPPPAELAMVQQVEALRRRVAHAWSLANLGEVEPALAEAEVLVEEADALGYRPLQAEALYLRAWLIHADGRYAEAVEHFERAYLLAAEIEHEVVVMDTVRLLVFVLSEHLGDLDRAKWWSQVAESRSRRTGDEPYAMISLSEGRGALRALQGKTDAALVDYRLALQLKRAMGVHPLHESTSLINLGSVLDQVGRTDEALEYTREALALIELAVGPRHPGYAITRNNIGTMLLDQGRPDEALVEHRLALRIWEDALGPEHPSVGVAWANIGNVHQAQGRLPEALAAFERARALWERSLGPENIQVAQLLNNMGDVLALQHRVDEALEHMRRAHSIFERAMGPEHPYVAQSLANLGLLYRQRGRLDEASEHLGRARDIYERAVEPDDPALAHALVGLVRVELLRGTPQVAQPWAERAVVLLEASDPRPFELAYARLMLALTLWPDPDPEQQARARALAERARAGYVALGDEAMAARIDAWLRDPASSEDDFSLAR